MEDTKSQYHNIISKSRKIFIDKNSDYGSSWRVLRIISLVDQINIKAQRIRNLQNNIDNKIEENQSSEFYGIINYSIMGLIQLDKGVVAEPDFVSGQIIDWKEKPEPVTALQIFCDMEGIPIFVDGVQVPQAQRWLPATGLDPPALEGTAAQSQTYRGNTWP